MPHVLRLHLRTSDAFASWLCIALLLAASGNAAEETNSLLTAVRRGDAGAWRAALSSTSVRARDHAGNTALHMAALNHDLAAVNALLEAGAEPDARNAEDATPLLYAAGHAGIVRVLLARGADANAVSRAGNRPLMVAVGHPDAYEAVRLLVEAGADVRAKKGDVEVNLSRAASVAERRTVELLLARGAAEDPTSAASALATAAFRGDAALVELLLAHGADPNLKPSFSGHALNYALLAEHGRVAEMLIEKGADPELRSEIGHATPPIIFAAYNQSGDTTAARALRARGVDINAANEQGATALSYALRSGADTALVEFLRSAGAKAPESTRRRSMPDRPVPATPAARAALVRERLPATLKLLHESSDAFLENGFVQKSGCTSCHGQDLPAMAYDLARQRGLAVDDVSFGRQLASLTSRWQQRAESARQMVSPAPGAPVSIAYGLAGLRAAGYASDEMTDAMVRYLVRRQQRDGFWSDPIRRPPMEDGDLVATGWVTLSLRDYPPTGLAAETSESLRRAGKWLAAQKPATHNETVFQLLGLYWSGAPAEEIDQAGARLLKAQREDGGWAQLPGLASDAWATGTALYALHEARAMRSTDGAYQRGVAYLLRTQFEDGSWWVRSRSWPFQPHFNGRFPHGKDQWISQAGTAWAAMALLFTLDPVSPAPRAPTVPQMIETFAKSPAAQGKKPAPAASSANATAAATVDFARDIQPLFKRSCAGCHNGDKPRGDLIVTSRERLLKGGASGEPAIVPGYADDSPLIQYVLGKIEDLEMPPLDRREKYPPLTPAEIDLFRAWIDAGAPWAAAIQQVTSTTPEE